MSPGITGEKGGSMAINSPPGLTNGQLKEHLKIIFNNHEGRANAITSRKLSILTGAPDRTIRLCIRELISENMPILSATENPPGYFLPISMNEVRKYAASLRDRLIEDARRRRDVIRGGDLYLKPASQGRMF